MRSSTSTQERIFSTETSDIPMPVTQPQSFHEDTPPAKNLINPSLNPLKTKNQRRHEFVEEDERSHSSTSASSRPSETTPSEIKTKTSRCHNRHKFEEEHPPPISPTPASNSQQIEITTKTPQCQEYVEKDTPRYSTYLTKPTISNSSVKKTHMRKTKTKQQAPLFRAISIKWAFFLLVVTTLLRVVRATDCGVMSTWLSVMFSATGTECCSQTGITCVNDRITEM
jgi:hypothetical protein